ncbi:MAG: DEAD/DEAH box helicase [Spirochaetales bacterium]|nr:DEAD/DEAH box helicase [Spirochaetales bacterium]
MTKSDVPPLIVQGDNTILVDVHTILFEEARDELGRFAELEKSPEHMHTYKISPLSLWNAASSGIELEEIFDILDRYGRFPAPENVRYNIGETLKRWGKIRLEGTGDEGILFLRVEDPYLHKELATAKSLAKILTKGEKGFFLELLNRGTVKAELIKIGWPVEDLAPLVEGADLDVELNNLTVREYQKHGVEAFLGNGKPGTGFGTVVMPCGSGKTVLGIAAMAALKKQTLILTPNVASLHQWRDEILSKTNLTEDQIGEYSGEQKIIKPVTLATYQVLVWRKDKTSPFTHFSLFRENDWGLIIYDEVHLLPAPVFKITAELQARRRLGLTATLIREDGAEGHVFSLVGPKRFDIPWKELEQQGWIAEAYCHEIRIDLPDNLQLPYASADKRKKYRIASENPLKLQEAAELVERHKNDQVLIIGQYIDQLEKMAKLLKADLITGKTPNADREVIYDRFKKGEIQVIVVSKVANFAIDLPDASVAIQLSGAFGSRQEEAQRLGRILRPKQKNSFFYSLISRFTTEEEFAMNRQKFLTEQGYKYQIEVRGEPL